MRTAAVALSGLALATAVWGLPRALRSAQAQVRTTAGETLLDRELAAAKAFSVHESLATEAAAILPRNATFYVATGGASTATGAYPGFYAYWLLPRRRVEEPQQAQWILDAGADPGSLGVHVDVARDLGGGVQILKVKR